MRLPPLVERALQQEDFNFLVTNRVPRRLLTRFMGWFSRVEQPLVSRLSIATFALFAGDLRLREAKKTTFTSLHDCFVRELKDGARPLDSDPRVLVSPCDGIVGAFGTIEDAQLLQAKGSAYSLEELLGDEATVDAYRNGTYVTLRLTAAMYHRFHAPCGCRFDGTTCIPGDSWNVNPTALKRIERLYCRNERVAIRLRASGTSESVTLVAVGAILVGSIRLSFDIASRPVFRKGDELGYFHHGSTIIVLGTPGLELCDRVRPDSIVRVGQGLLRIR